VVARKNKYYNYMNWSGNAKNVKHGYHYNFFFKYFSFCFYFSECVLRSGWVCRITHRFTRCDRALNDFHLCTADIIIVIKIGRGPCKVHWRLASSVRWCVCSAANLYVNFQPTPQTANRPNRSCKYPRISSKNTPPSTTPTHDVMPSVWQMA